MGRSDKKKLHLDILKVLHANMLGTYIYVPCAQLVLSDWLSMGSVLTGKQHLAREFIKCNDNYLLRLVTSQYIAGLDFSETRHYLLSEERKFLFCETEEFLKFLYDIFCIV